jgi:hypothetical protein
MKYPGPGGLLATFDLESCEMISDRPCLHRSPGHRWRYVCKQPACERVHGVWQADQGIAINLGMRHFDTKHAQQNKELLRRLEEIMQVKGHLTAEDYVQVTGAPAREIQMNVFGGSAHGHWERVDPGDLTVTRTQIVDSMTRQQQKLLDKVLRDHRAGRIGMRSGQELDDERQMLISALTRNEREQRKVEEKERHIAETYGIDDWKIGTVITFDYQFNKPPRSSNRIYQYAIMKCESGWYSSGPNTPDARTWDQMIAFWERGTVSNMRVAKTWKEFVPHA